jgi:hypothetical protein
MYLTGVHIAALVHALGELTCSLSLDVEVRLIVSAWLRQGPLPAVVEIPHEPVPVGPLVVRLG